MLEVYLKWHTRWHVWVSATGAAFTVRVMHTVGLLRWRLRSDITSFCNSLNTGTPWKLFLQFLMFQTFLDDTDGTGARGSWGAHHRRADAFAVGHFECFVFTIAWHANLHDVFYFRRHSWERGSQTLEVIQFIFCVRLLSAGTLSAPAAGRIVISVIRSSYNCGLSRQMRNKFRACSFFSSI